MREEEFSRVCVVGDFNFPNIDWVDVSTRGLGEAFKMCTLVNDNLLTQLVDGPILTVGEIH